eukprot:SAG11_NODE_25023_length_364_cov_1.637736_1_plen_106_part_10
MRAVGPIETIDAAARSARRRCVRLRCKSLVGSSHFDANQGRERVVEYAARGRSILISIPDAFTTAVIDDNGKDVSGPSRYRWIRRSTNVQQILQHLACERSLDSWT